MQHRFFILTILVLCAVILPIRAAFAEQRCFPEQPDVAACLADPFSDYWEANGGLPVFGYPIGNSGIEHNAELNADLTVQWTERYRLELHPDKPAPYTILLGRMGAERLTQLGRDPFAVGRESGPQQGCLWFEETGHNVCDQDNGLGFKTYWVSNGVRIADLSPYDQSLQLFGLPLTTAQVETNSSGAPIMTQWFERARFEWHPDNPDTFKVQLGLLGAETRGPVPVAAPAQNTSFAFGVDVSESVAVTTAPQAQAAGIQWAHASSVPWALVEPTPGTRNWNALQSLDTTLQAFSAHNLTPIVTIFNTPDWAQQRPGISCGPIKPEAYSAFAVFLTDLVTRYRQPPFNVHYWEIGNEPDIDPSLVSPDSGFGCWGQNTDPFYGGAAYGQMLQQVYPAIKQADPQAQVVFGGLLLDCDPDHPPAGKSCEPAHFLEGALKSGAGGAFDLLAYHGYAYWVPNRQDWDLNNPNWGNRGGPVLGKLAFVRDILARYGQNKPVFLNEAGLLCYQNDSSCGEAFDAAQANYVLRLYTRTWAAGVRSVLWYSLDDSGWRKSGLLDAALQPRPAYHALQQLAQRLNGAQFAGTRSAGDVEGYAFAREGTRYEVYWTNDNRTVVQTLPTGARAAYNALGEPVPLDGPTITVSFDPILIEIGS